MAIYRKLWLVNGDGREFDLTDRVDEFFLANIGGFGAESEIGTVRLGNSEYASSFQYNMINIEGTIYFHNEKGNPYKYQSYQDFFVFCNQLPLYLYYEPPHRAGNPVYRQVLLNKVEKTEVSPKTKALECPVSFKPLTFWIDSSETVVTASPQDEGEGKKYPLDRPYAYKGDSLKHVTLINKSPFPVPLKINIDGEFGNFSYSLFTKKGELYGNGKIIDAYTMLNVEINSDDLNENLYIKNIVGEVAMPANNQDFSICKPGVDFTFLYLQPGENFIAFDFEKISNYTRITLSYPGGVYASI